MDYKEALAYLEELSVFGIQLGLGRIERLLSMLDMPQSRYRAVHVTGTNGKGSVSVMVAGILRASSIRTGLYTSPHLESYTERIQVDGQPISEKEFADCLSAVKVYVDRMVANGEECPTQFEVITAVAFFYFAMRHVEYAVIEVGLGGLLDSTNVIHPDVSVITNVSLEHADKCGGTLEGVAHHKAGIIKKGVPVVTAAKGMPLDIIRREAAEKNADVFVLGEEFSSEFVRMDGAVQTLEFTSALLGMRKETYDLRLLGIHQVENSAVALMAAALLHHTDERIDFDSARKAFRLISWPGRFERMEVGNQQVILDGAHNPAGIRMLRATLDRYFPTEPRTFLLGILRDKSVEAMLQMLLREGDAVVVTEPPSERAARSEEVAALAGQCASFVEALARPEAALDRAMALADGKGILVIAGSLYLIGDIRSRLLQRRG